MTEERKIHGDTRVEILDILLYSCDVSIKQRKRQSCDVLLRLHRIWWKVPPVVIGEMSSTILDSAR